MNYLNRSASELLRGPVLHTPQGRILLAATALYWLHAACIAVLGLQPPPRWSVDAALFILIAWTFIFFLILIKDNNPSFLPSWRHAAWLGGYACFPFLYPFVQHIFK